VIISTPFTTIAGVPSFVNWFMIEGTPTTGPTGWCNHLAKFCQVAYIAGYEHDEHFVA
jgi:hypothetical protein